MKTLFSTLLLTVFMGNVLWANAVRIESLSMDQDAGTVSFALSWQNSWRVETEPLNWDAVWVFVKFRDCAVAPEDQWTHGLLSTALGDHNFGGSLEPTNQYGTTVGLDAAPNNTGAMLRHNTVGLHSPAGPYAITMRVTNLPDATIDIDLRVFAIEMVHIPTGNFWVGDNSLAWNSYRFVETLIDGSETEISWVVSSGLATQTAPLGAFPRGQQPFYVMKYEITQEQYARFLNTIPATMASTLYPGAPGTLGNRFTITNLGTPPNIYEAGVRDRACNFLTWGMVSGYLDWAALRPMSELEYEKVCRGPAPVVAGEYAWGTTNIFNGTIISATTPAENGEEVFVNDPQANAVFGSVNYTGNPTASVGPNGARGPVRSGIFATPATDSRQAAGATYYNVLEMSGNVSEYCVAISANTGSAGPRPFLPTLGDGYLGGDGFHDVADWPEAPIPPGGAAQNQWVGWRGGCFFDNPTVNFMVGNRTRTTVLNATWNFGAENTAITNQFYTGGRGIR